jgi:hypothetical protein
VSNTVDFFCEKLISELNDELLPYEPDFDLPYMLFGDLALLMTDAINEKKIDIQNKGMAIIEEMILASDGDVYDLLTVGFLEVFLDHKVSRDYIKKYGSLKLKSISNKISMFWREDD